MTTAPTMTATDLALEMAMAIHLSAGNLLELRVLWACFSFEIMTATHTAWVESQQVLHGWSTLTHIS